MDSGLPSHIEYQILSRITSLQTLDTCKVVCKEWKNMIYEPYFMPELCQKTGIFSGYLLQEGEQTSFVSPDRSNSSFNGFPKDKKILASSKQGILCCVKSGWKNERYFVGKPAIRQWRSIPNPKLRYWTEMVGIVVLGSNPLHYKILRLSRDTRPHINMMKPSSPIYHSHRCEIFDSKTWKWKQCTDLHLQQGEVFDPPPCISVGSKLYCLTTNNLLSFDVETESYMRLPLPKDDCNCRLVEYEGRVGILTLVVDLMELWFMKDLKWMKGIQLNRREFDKYSASSIIRGMYNSGIVFLEGIYEVVFHNLQDQKSSRKVNLDMLFMSTVFEFRSDSEQVQL